MKNLILRLYTFFCWALRDPQMGIFTPHGKTEVYLLLGNRKFVMSREKARRLAALIQEHTRRQDNER